MSLFSSILQNIKKKIDSEQSYKDVVINTILNKTNITLTPNNISLKNNVLYITTNPTIKMALLLKKDTLIQDLQSSGVKVVTIK